MPIFACSCPSDPPSGAATPRQAAQWAGFVLARGEARTWGLHGLLSVITSPLHRVREAEPPPTSHHALEEPCPGEPAKRALHYWVRAQQEHHAELALTPVVIESAAIQNHRKYPGIYIYNGLNCHKERWALKV